MAGRRLRLGAVLLAGGASRRFGAENKLLASVDGRPLLARVAIEIVAAGVDDLVIVTGAEHNRYVEALAGLDARFVENGSWDDGIGSSIAVGVRALDEALDGAFIVPGDLPNLTAGVFERLATAFEEEDGVAVIVPATADGQQRNPVLWPRSYFPALARLEGPRGGKSLLDTSDVARVDVIFEDESVFADIDTQDDYARFTSGA